MRNLWVALLLTGCGVKCQHQECSTACDKVVQERVFLSCLEKLPNGPDKVAATGNDWDEVVSECASAAARVACVLTCVERDGYRHTY
jgi:hypothetical protein